MKEIKILSIQGCPDPDYGESMIQYQVGNDFVAFMFSPLTMDSILFDPSQLLHSNELQNQLKSVPDRPLWSDLSNEIRVEIEVSDFDMHFIEYDDEDWTHELADKVWNEAQEKHLDTVVRRGEDDCYLTVYAGAMNEVNWHGHPLFGKPYFLKEVEIDLEQLKSPLDHMIRSAASRTSEAKEKGRSPELER